MGSSGKGGALMTRFTVGLLSLGLLLAQPGKDARAEAPPDVAPVAPAAKAGPELGYDGGFFVRTTDKRYSLYVNGFAWLRYTISKDSTDGSKLNNNFDLGLGRLAFSGNIFDPRLSYFLQFEGSTFGNNNGVRMLDWWMKWTVSPYFYVLAGRTILPYSRQFYTHPGNLLLPDLSAADQAFNLTRTIGVKAGGQAGRIGYDVFLTNSVRPLDVGTQVNVGDSIAAGARLELDILKPYGYIETIPTADAEPQLSVGAAVAFNPVADPSGLQNVQRGDKTINFTADAGFRWKRVSVQGAFYYRRDYDKAMNDFGYYAQAGVYIVSERLEVVARASGVHFFDRGLTGGTPP
jgi:hypothetical protein